jgi:hypothetical protein
MASSISEASTTFSGSRRAPASCKPRQREPAAGEFALHLDRVDKLSTDSIDETFCMRSDIRA